VDDNEWAGGEELSELLWSDGTESDSGETRVVSVRRLEPDVTLARVELAC